MKWWENWQCHTLTAQAKQHTQSKCNIDSLTTIWTRPTFTALSLAVQKRLWTNVGEQIIFPWSMCLCLNTKHIMHVMQAHYHDCPLRALHPLNVLCVHQALLLAYDTTIWTYQGHHRLLRWIQQNMCINHGCQRLQWVMASYLWIFAVPYHRLDGILHDAWCISNLNLLMNPSMFPPSILIPCCTHSLFLWLHVTELSLESQFYVVP